MSEHEKILQRDFSTEFVAHMKKRRPHVALQIRLDVADLPRTGAGVQVYP